MTYNDIRKDNKFDTVCAYLAGYYAAFEEIGNDDNAYFDRIEDALNIIEQIEKSTMPLTKDEDNKEIIDTEQVRYMVEKIVADYCNEVIAKETDKYE